VDIKYTTINRRSVQLNKGLFLADRGQEKTHMFKGLTSIVLLHRKMTVNHHIFMKHFYFSFQSINLPLD